MGRNEIRLRRKGMADGSIARHRNYEELMEKHQRHLRIRRIAVACIYMLLIICLLVIYVVMKRQPAPGSPDPKTASAATQFASAGVASAMQSDDIYRG